MFNYIFESKTYEDASEEFMQSLGMNAEQIDSVLNQQKYELNDGAIKSRESAYKKESDPLFLEWQYDKTPESEMVWRDKVLEIKARHPINGAKNA
jgi:hypothetical protein